MCTAAVTPITTESAQVDLNIPTAAEISTSDVSPRYLGTPDPRQSIPIPMNMSSTENMTRVAKVTDTTAITVFPLPTTTTSAELSTTPIVPGIILLY